MAREHDNAGDIVSWRDLGEGLGQHHTTVKERHDRIARGGTIPSAAGSPKTPAAPTATRPPEPEGRPEDPGRRDVRPARLPGPVPRTRRPRRGRGVRDRRAGRRLAALTGRTHLPGMRRRARSGAGTGRVPALHRADRRPGPGKHMHVLPAPRPAFRGRTVTPGFLRRRRERRAAVHLDAQLQESADTAGRPGRRPVRALRVPTARDG